MKILQVVDRSVALREEPWREKFEKYAKCRDFRDFDDFSRIRPGPSRGSVKRYGHIYFLDRSRCPMSKFSKTFVGLKGPGCKNSKIQLQL